MQIRSKREFFRLWEAGVLGNRPPLWHYIADVPHDVARVGFREMNKQGGGGAWTLVDRIEAPDIYAAWVALGRDFIMDGSVPNNHSVMQGEVCRTWRGFESFLAVGYALPPMRISVAQGLHQHYGYVQTQTLLTYFMDPASRDDIDALFDLYPDAAVEFTCFDVETGNIRGRNTIIWEVRNY
jgi:hypothetical protein